MTAFELEPDPGARDKPLDELGWVGVERSGQGLDELRAYLEANNGIRGLEVVDPEDVERATRLFYRDGFVVVRDALDADQLAFLRAACDRAVHDILAFDKWRVGNRGSHRYSFGSASATGHQMHHPEWTMLLDLPTVTPILTSIFGSSDYIVRGGGGDFCLPGAVDYQLLHSDTQDRIEFQGATEGSFHDPRGLLTYRDLPCPYVCCNFLMVDSTPLNGPIRQIPGTQSSREPIPKLDEEPEWMKLSTLCPADAGGVVIRDVRAWHGGTPNLSEEVRALPNAEFFAPWYREPLDVSMPRDLYKTLSEHAKDICRYIVADPGEEIDTSPCKDLGTTPPAMRKRRPRISSAEDRASSAGEQAQKSS